MAFVVIPQSLAYAELRKRGEMRFDPNTNPIRIAGLAGGSGWRMRFDPIRGLLESPSPELQRSSST